VRIGFRAAQKARKLEWLASAYEDAMREAGKKKHMLVLKMKSDLAQLYIDYLHDYPRAEPLVTEIARVLPINQRKSSD
jgi:hypothetical protein